MASIFSNISAVSDLLNNFAAVDVVGIYDDSLQQVFANARPLKASVKESSMVMRHPVETGTMIADNHVINQVDITIPLMINSRHYNSVYGQIKQAFVSATLLSVQTRTGLYTNMIIADMPHEETPDQYDAVMMQLHLIEVLYVVPNSVSGQSAPANYKPSSPANSNTVQGGLKYPASVSTGNATAVRSILSGFAFKYLGGI